MSRSARHAIRNIKGGTRDVQQYIDENPISSAVLALAAGILATSVVKMTVGKPAAPGAKTTAPAAKPTDRKARRKKARSRAR
jgi:hypothetical protein